MDAAMEFIHPGLRSGVNVEIRPREASISLGARECSFEFSEDEQPAIAILFRALKSGGYSLEELQRQVPRIAEQLPALLADLGSIRVLTETCLTSSVGVVTGSQLYRELRRMATRVTNSVARSAFYNALCDGRADRRQLFGYGMEYYWLVRSAPGLIGPILASAYSAKERQLLEGFLASEIGHDKFIAAALESVGFNVNILEAHQPLPATFAIGASLGVYARQHPISFKACLFILEEVRPQFMDAFDRRCEALDLPPSFYRPFREHAEVNDEHDHGDISADLLALEHSVDVEVCTSVKRNVALMIESVVQQEEAILDYYGRPNSMLPRIFV
jgi:pyrroloquinoline quinone (PQQ) biosynthesis protein C